MLENFESQIILSNKLEEAPEKEYLGLVGISTVPYKNFTMTILTVQYSAALFYTVHYCVVLSRSVLYCTV